MSNDEIIIYRYDGQNKARNTEVSTDIQSSHTFNGKKKFQDFSRTFQDRQNVFPGPYRSLPTFKYKGKQQLLNVHTE